VFVFLPFIPLLFLISLGYEEAVSYSQARFASGGGFSFVASTPDYQKSAVANYLSSGVTLPPSGYYNANGRGFPDIAAFGSNVLISSGGVFCFHFIPFSFLWVFVSVVIRLLCLLTLLGQLEGVGGTSCSSPIVAGVVTLLNDYVVSKTGKPLGMCFYKVVLSLFVLFFRQCVSGS
jgi:tripeptidyl-peptidase-1